MQNNKYLFILIGKSGSGKGTQALNIVDYLKQNDNNRQVKHVTTGGGFRDFIQKDNYIASLSREVVQKGGLMPSFLSIWNWSNILIESLNNNDSLILDGAPRKLDEARALNDLANFLNFNNIFRY
jgi:adenylate kinase family enzyme